MCVGVVCLFLFLFFSFFFFVGVSLCSLIYCHKLLFHPDLLFFLFFHIHGGNDKLGVVSCSLDPQSFSSIMTF